MVAVSNVKPETLKGKYMKSASLCSTMGPGFDLDGVSNVDPSSAKFMLALDEIWVKVANAPIVHIVEASDKSI